MRWPTLSVRRKILSTIVVISALGLGVGAYAALDAVSQAKQRGRYLETPFSSYRDTLVAGNDGQDAVARMIASDPALVAALESGQADLIKADATRLARPLEGSLNPDYLIISDAAGNVFPAGKFKALSSDVWRGYRLFGDLRGGQLRGRIGVIARKPCQIAGAPIKSGEHIVGAVLVAKLLDGYFWDVANNSGSSISAQQHRLALVADDKVLVSALKSTEKEAFVAALANPQRVAEGDSSVPVLAFSNGLYDYWSEPLRGYERAADPSSHVVGRLVLVKERDQARQFWRSNWRLLMVFGVVLVLAVLFGYFLAVQITRPLRRYIRATEDLARGQGDLSKRLEVQTHDELGMLAGNLNRVFAKIHTLAAGVQRTAFQVGASSGQVSTVSKQMLDGAKEQAGKVSNSTAAVTELSSSIQQVAENAAEATRTAKQSGEAVTRAIHRLQRIRSTVDDAANRIGTLGESGKRIGKIVEVIRQISEQTSMLALNAAIEAAHAGEHGRGFAVVADEVSSLAKRVGQSARDIEDLIATIRDQTGEAVRVMQAGTREVEEGTGLVEATLADLQTLISVIDDTASAVQEQAIASDEIARNMDAVQRIAVNVVQSSENAVDQGDQLQQLADELERSVKGFRIDPEQVALDEAELKQLPEGKA